MTIDSSYKGGERRLACWSNGLRGLLARRVALPLSFFGMAV